jgi:hypothetical protein
MALILISLKDKGDGSVSVELDQEPGMLPGQTEFTVAQQLGALALKAIFAELSEPKILTPGSSKLQLVGADEMPH